GSAAARSAPELARQAERKIALARRLPDVLDGDDRTGDNAERLAFARMSYDARRYAGATRLWAEALDADLAPGESRDTKHHYDAACAAVLAADGQGLDDAALDDAARTKLREQALRWLEDELVVWTGLLEAKPQARPVVAQNLEHWRKDADLISV